MQKKDGSGISRIKIDSQHTHTGIILQKTNFCFQMDHYFLFSIPSHNHHHHVQPIIISIHLVETKEKIQTKQNLHLQMKNKAVPMIYLFWMNPIFLVLVHHLLMVNRIKIRKN